MEIQIRRKERPHGHLPPEIVGEARKKLGSVYLNRAPLRGLSFEQEKQFLPEILGISKDDPKFTEACLKYWADLSIDVPQGGAVLNIAVDPETKRPLFLEDWIKYQFALRHPEVALSKEEMEGNPRKSYYIYDPEKETRAQNQKILIELKAAQQFTLAVQNEDMCRRLVRVLGQRNPDHMTKEQRENYLYTLMKAQPERFFQAATDKDLELQDLLFQLLSASVLRKVGQTYFYMDLEIGQTEEEAVAFLKSSRNSRQVSDMKAKLKEALEATAV